MGRLFITAEFKDKEGATVQKAFKEEEKHFLNTNTGVYTNVGLAYMGFMNKDFYFIKGDLNTKGYYGFNKMELKIVRFLYKIRNANKYKEHPILKTSTISEMVFSMSLTGQRIFIAGRIIPQILIKINGFNDVDCNTTKIEIKSKWSGLKLYDGFYPKGWGNHYLDIDNGRIKIFVPDAENEQNRNVLFNFLTNSESLKFVVEHGEFSDMETYELATGKKTMVKEEACWLESDRTANNQIWKNACEYIIKNQVSSILAPFGQIANFYDYVEIRLKAVGHEVRWTRGARALVHMLADGKWKMGGLDGGSNLMWNNIEIILNELNLNICNYAITQFYRLLHGEYKKSHLKGEAAYQFDLQFITYEQGFIAVPIYSKASAETIKDFQKVADQKFTPFNFAAIGADMFNTVTPKFSDFSANVTDVQFRIDLPILMLWLDRHKPISFHLLNNDGKLDEEIKKKIRKFYNKLISPNERP